MKTLHFPRLRLCRGVLRQGSQGVNRRLQLGKITFGAAALAELHSVSFNNVAHVDERGDKNIVRRGAAQLEELKSRQPDDKPPFRVRLVLTGSELDDPAFTKLLEDCGAMVVADRYCYGSLPSREPIEIKPGESALRAVARHYLMTSQCPRFMSRERADARKAYIRTLAEEYKADGVIYNQMKFCEYWSYERVLGVHIVSEKFGIPCIGIEREYSLSSAGQLRTRFQAFIESIEIKEIKGGSKNG